MGVRGNNFHRTYKEMSAARDATQTVKQKFDVLTELIEDIDQKMDLIVARINTEAPRETPTTPPAREQVQAFHSAHSDRGRLSGNRHRFHRKGS